MISLKNLFAVSSGNETIQENVGPINNSKNDGETYKDYGFRLAGLSQGSNSVLPSCLQSVCLGIKQKQAEDTCLQQQLQQKLEGEKTQLEVEQENKKNELTACQQKQSDINGEIAETKSRITQLDDSKYNRNRDAWITFIITAVILVPFTVYFFIFYSSVAYSAFFDQFDFNDMTGSTLAKAIFNPHAIPNALNDGIGELLFILFMPIIFLAFGFVLNRWERENGFLKYLKIPSLIFVAFSFDALLAFSITKKLYNLAAMTELGDVPPYTRSMAATDADFWVVICLGFVSYLIWGFVFGYFIKSWESLDLSVVQKRALEENLGKLTQDLNAEKQKEVELKSLINDLGAKITQISTRMNGGVVRYDIDQLKLELNNFFAGWQTYLSVLDRSNGEKEEAQEILNKMVNSLNTQE